jgi:hypothetical protein
VCVFAGSNHLFLEDWSAAAQRGEDVSQFRAPQTLAEKQERLGRSQVWKSGGTFEVGPFALMFDEKAAEELATFVKPVVDWFTRPAEPS